jgi:Zn-dependent M28 family amino/carboxypeptidase
MWMIRSTWGVALAAAAMLMTGHATNLAQTAAPPDLAKALATVHASAVRAHVEMLADDLLEGRLPGTRGYDLAARYVATQLSLIGLKPAGDGGTFFQQVPLVESRLTTGTMTVRGKTGDPVTLADRTDFMMAGDVHRTEASVDAPVVFAGYGISAPDLQHDDYAGLDVRGKVVLVLSNAPVRFPTEPRAHFANRRLKAQVAAGHGAIGLIFVRILDDEKRMPWARVSSVDPTSVAWLDNGVAADVPKALEGAAMLSPTGARTLFGASGASGANTLDRVLAEAEAGAPKGFPLDVTVRLTSRSEHRRITSPNVAGIVEGSDPALRDTFVVYSAHLDHVGVGAEVKGDRIYNGAYDNAMGTALLIEAARALASLQPRPKRSVLVVFVTAEEKGLVGSDYFAAKPTVARDRIVANVNVDMPLLLFPLNQVVAFGAENSTLEGVARRAAGLAGLTLIADPMPEENLFVRSDQYSFVRRGVPAMFLVPGFTSSDAGVDGVKLFREFLSTHYHQPSDDLTRPVDAASVERFTRANVALGYLIANDTTAPAWKPGNFFGRTFAKGR